MQHALSEKRREKREEKRCPLRDMISIIFVRKYLFFSLFTFLYSLYEKTKIPLDILGKEWYHTMRVVNTTQ